MNVHVLAPGRVNLIGEHTDYNDGFVLPMAIDRATWIALRARPDHRVRLFSLDHQELLEFDVDHLEKKTHHWGEYPKSIAWALREAGYALQGWEGVMAGSVPIAAGLSSSASIEMVVARAFAAASSIAWNPAVMARLGQRAENEWIGVNCGIMDQMITAAGQADHALLIDCRTLQTEPEPLPAGTVIAVLDTATRRGLVDSKYNERRSQCETAARFFGVKALRDVSVDQFESRALELDDIIRKRARHVVTENARTLKAAHTRDPVTFGKLMNASHLSLRDDFEVTNHELNVIVECAWQSAGCLGGRMTGAGFGGCAVALVAAGDAERFTEEVASRYAAATGLTSQIYLTRATDGASII